MISLFSMLAIITLPTMVAGEGLQTLPPGPTGSPQCVVVIDRRHAHQCWDAAIGADRDVLDWEKGLRANGQDARGDPLNGR